MISASAPTNFTAEALVLSEGETEQAQRKEQIGCTSLCQYALTRLRELRLGFGQRRFGLQQLAFSEASPSIHRPREPEMGAREPMSERQCLMFPASPLPAYFNTDSAISPPDSPTLFKRSLEALSTEHIEQLAHRAVAHPCQILDAFQSVK